MLTVAGEAGGRAERQSSHATSQAAANEGQSRLRAKLDSGNRHLPGHWG